MKYEIELSPTAIAEIKHLKKAGEKAALKKIDALLNELEKHPTTGTGHPKPLSGDRVAQWSRRITDKHRLVYSIDDDKVIVLVISVSGHYGDK